MKPIDSNRSFALKNLLMLVLLLLSLIMVSCTPEPSSSSKKDDDTGTESAADTSTETETDTVEGTAEDRIRFDGTYLFVFESENKILATAEFEIKNSSFSGDVKNIFGQEFDVEGRVEPNGDLSFGPIKLSNDEEIITDINGKFTDEGIIQVGYTIGDSEFGDREGDAVGYFYEEATERTDYDGDYIISLLAFGDHKYFGEVLVRRGILSGDLIDVDGNTFRMTGKVLKSGIVVLDTDVSAPDELLTGMAAIDGNGRVTGEYFATKRQGEIEGHRLNNIPLAMTNPTIGYLDAPDTDLIAIATDGVDEAIMVYREPRERNDDDEELAYILFQANDKGPVAKLTVDDVTPKVLEIDGFTYTFSDFTGSFVSIEIEDSNGSVTQSEAEFISKRGEIDFEEDPSSKKNTRVKWIKSAAALITEVSCAIGLDGGTFKNDSIWDLVAFGCTSPLSTGIAITSLTELLNTAKELNSEDSDVLKDFDVASAVAPWDPRIIIEEGAAKTDDTTVSVEISAVDNVKVTHYFITEDLDDVDDPVEGPEDDDPNWKEVDDDDDDDDDGKVEREKLFEDEIKFTMSEENKLGEYKKTIYVWFKDAADQVSERASDDIILVVVDEDKPSSPKVQINGGDEFTDSTIVSLRLSANDDEGVTSYYVSEDGKKPEPDSLLWVSVTESESFLVNVSFTITSSSVAGDNKKFVYAWFQDAAGNISTMASAEIQLRVSDENAPTSPGVAIFSNFSNAFLSGENGSSDASTTSTAVTLRLTAEDDAGVSAYFASEVPHNPAGNANGWKSVNPTKNFNSNEAFNLENVDVVGSHQKTVYVWFKDLAGNISARASSSITLIVEESTDPFDLAVNFEDPGAPLSSPDVILSLDASDNIGITDYFVSESEISPTSNDDRWISIGGSRKHYTANVQYHFSSVEGIGTHEKAVYVWFRNTQGKIGGPISTTITLDIEDTEAPTNPKISINGGVAETESTLVGLDLSAQDNVAVTAYFASESLETPAPNHPGWVPVNPDTAYSGTVGFILSTANDTGDHSRTVYVWFKDKAGQVSLRDSDTITLVVDDTDEPCLPTVSINGNDVNTDSTTVNLTLSARDDVRVTAYYASESLSSPAADQDGWEIVNKSTSSTPINEGCTVDTSKSYIYSEIVGFTLSPADEIGEHTRTVYVWYKDDAGNVSDPDGDDILLKVEDTDEPVSTSVIINTGTDVTESTLVNVALVASDDEGITAYYLSETNETPLSTDNGWILVDEIKEYSQTVPFIFKSETEVGDYNKTIYAWFKDDAGNVSDVRSDNIQLSVVDIDKPVNPFVAIEGGAAATESASVVLNLSAEDNVGVTAYLAREDISITPPPSDPDWITVDEVESYSDVVPYTLTNETEIGEYTKTVYAWFKDDAGRVSDAVSDTITLQIKDNQAPKDPSIEIEGGDETTSSTLVRVRLSANDNQGIVSYAIAESLITPSARDWILIDEVKDLSMDVHYVLSDARERGDHIRTLFVWFRDEDDGDGDGNTSNAVSDSIVLNVSSTDAPQDVELVIDGDAVATDDIHVSLNLTATDDEGVSGYFLSETPIEPSSSAAGWVPISETTSYNANIDYTLSSESEVGEYTKFLYVWFKDSDDNISQAASDHITLEVDDTDKPTSPEITINNGNHTTTTTLVTLNLAAQDDTGVTAYYLSDVLATPLPSADGWILINETKFYSATVNYTLSGETVVGDHEKTLYAWFKDDAGNVSDPANDLITLSVDDLEAPEVSTLSVNRGDASTDSTFANLTIAGTDNKGITAYFASENETPPAPTADSWILIDETQSYSDTVSFILETEEAGETTKTIFLWFKDENGNVSDAQSDSILLNVTDEDEPTKPDVDVNGGEAITHTTLVNLALSAEDNVGVSAYFVSESPTTPSATTSGWVQVAEQRIYSTNIVFNLATAPEPGSYNRTVYVWFKDAVGNVSESENDSITLVAEDTEKPTDASIEIIEDGPVFETEVTIRLRAKDNVGVTGYLVSEALVTPGNDHEDWVSVTSEEDYDRTFNYQMDTESEEGTFTKTMYVWFKDDDGNISEPVSDNITIQVDIPENMVLVEAGSFVMGSDFGNLNEKEPHIVKLTRSFYIGETEVTAGQYKACVDADKCDYDDDKDDPRKTYGVSGREDRPMNFVSWEQAEEYIDWLTQTSEHVTYRFCTEAEWEYAARADTVTRWSCGQNESCVLDVAWISLNSDDDPQDVKQKDANAFDLYDMHGNVWEWVQDYESDSYSALPVEDPVGPSSGVAKVARGGSFITDAEEARSAFRAAFPPATRDVDVGFRVCASQ